MTDDIMKTRYDYICDKLLEVFYKPQLLSMHLIEHRIYLKDYAELIPHLWEYQISQKESKECCN